MWDLLMCTYYLVLDDDLVIADTSIHPMWPQGGSDEEAND